MENTAKIALLGLILLTVVSSGCTNEQKTQENTSGQTKPIEGNLSQRASGFTLSSVGDDGVSNWQLEGESADITDEWVTLRNVRIKSQAKENTVTMSAKKGIIKKDEDVGIFKEDVILAYDDGTTVRTDNINWSFKNQTGKTDASVLVKSGDLETKASGASLKKGNNELRLNKDISMRTSAGTVIKCTGPLVMDYKKNIAVLNNRVSIENDKGKMMSRKMVVFFDPAKKKVLRAEATGDVFLSRGSSISKSDKAVYFCEEGKAILTGHPTVFVDSEEARKMADGN